MITIDSGALFMGNDTTVAQQKYSALLIAHELAHHVVKI